jgi:sugar phosphate permease
VRSPTGRWRLVGLLVSGMTFCYAQRGTLSIAAPFMIHDLGINTETMGLMLSAFSWCYCFMQVPSGWIVDRFGVRRAYACGFGLWSIACALTGAFRNIAAIMFFRITMGVGQSVAFPASARTVANWFPDTERGLVNSSYLVGVRLGQALINAIGVGLAPVLPRLWPGAAPVDRAVDDRAAQVGNFGSERHGRGGVEPFYVRVELRSLATSHRAGDVPWLLCL